MPGRGSSGWSAPEAMAALIAASKSRTHRVARTRVAALFVGGFVAVRERKKATFAIGETVKVISGPLSDFSGEISEMNEDASRLKVLVSIFGRETPVEVGFDQVKKV